MKRINLILASILISSLAVAKPTRRPIPATSTIAVTNPPGSSLFKVHYRSVKTQDVKVSVLDETGSLIFNETIKNTDRFVRPYNFKDLAHGEYTIQIEDANGKTFEKINFTKRKIEKWVRVSKVNGADNKFSIIVTSPKNDSITINIFDKENNLIHSETQMVSRAFAKVYQLKGVESFNIEISDATGIVKSVNY
ncbi:MAG: hypothetical protein QM734_05350 [Cyclobacteriaceae bacterium]